MSKYNEPEEKEIEVPIVEEAVESIVEETTPVVETPVVIHDGVISRS